MSVQMNNMNLSECCSLVLDFIIKSVVLKLSGEKHLCMSGQINHKLKQLSGSVQTALITW